MGGFGAGVLGSGNNLKEAPGAGCGQVVAGEQGWGNLIGSFLHDLYVSCGIISSIFCKLALEAKQCPFGFPKCCQFSRKLSEVGAVLLATSLDWGSAWYPWKKRDLGTGSLWDHLFRSSLGEWV